MSSTAVSSVSLRSISEANDNSSHFDEDRSSFSLEDGGPEWQLNRLFGREQESQTIQDLADERSTNILILHGTAGSGKSSLIERQPWEQRGWIFAAGKYEKSRMNEPYSGLISALNSLVDQWFENNKHAHVCQMPSFHNLLEEDIQFLKNIVPRAFDLVGAGRTTSSTDDASIASSSPIITLDGAEYVNAGFWRILSFLCEPRPVVLFLDDIQWTDQASLDALKLIGSTGNVKGLLLVMAYRQEEVMEGDRISKFLHSIEADSQQTIHKIFVSDLPLIGVNELVSRVLNLDLEQTQELSTVILRKTAGNPFFVVQFLQLLRHERFLQFSPMTFHWDWGDIDQMEKFAHVSDNVAEVIAATMSKLPIPTRLSLKVASCLGKNIPLHVMIEFFDDLDVQSDMLMVCDALKRVQMCGLKSVLDKAVKYGILTRSDDQTQYTWAHDKLQHVAYSMIPEEMRPQIHMKLGKLLWRMSSEDADDEWMLFMAAHQLNRFADDVSGDSLGEDVARLSFEAGKLSLSKSALYPALDMLRCAVRHIGPVESAWVKSYDLCLDLYSALGEVAARLGNHDEAMEAVSQVLRYSKSLDDKFRAQVVLLRCHSHGNDRNYRKTAESILDFLHDYGVKFPNKLLPGQQYLERRKLKSRLGGNLETLINLHRLDVTDDTDRRNQIVLVMLAHLGTYAWFVPDLRSLSLYASTRALNMSIKHGICPATAVVLANLALHLNATGHKKEALEYGNSAVKLVDTFPQGLGSAHAQVHGAVTFGVMTSLLPFNNLLDRLLEVNRIGLKTGDTEKASTGLMTYSFAYLCVGLPLGPLESDLVSFAMESRQFGMPNTVQVMYAIFRQTIHNLQTMQPDPTLLKGEAFDQEKELNKFNGQGLVMTKRDVNTFRLMLACFYRTWETAAELVDALEFCLDTDKFPPRAHLRLTYMGIACLVLGQRGGGRIGHYRQLGRKIIKKFKDDIKSGSQNALPVLRVLEAIEAPTKEHYDVAIRTCARLGLIQLQAITYEFAGLDYLKQGDMGWAEHYLEQSLALYHDWGATGKANQLHRDHDDLLRNSSRNFSARGSALKGRSRYDPENIAQLKQVDWSSSNSIVRTSLSASKSSFNIDIPNGSKYDVDA